jgi:hypothetical protein
VTISSASTLGCARSGEPCLYLRQIVVQRRAPAVISVLFLRLLDYQILVSLVASLVHVNLRVYMLCCRRSLQPSFKFLYAFATTSHRFSIKSQLQSQSQPHSITTSMNADQFREAAHAAIEESTHGS